jgi:hypothetical protein
VILAQVVSVFFDFNFPVMNIKNYLRVFICSSLAFISLEVMGGDYIFKSPPDCITKNCDWYITVKPNVECKNGKCVEINAPLVTPFDPKNFLKTADIQSIGLRCAQKGSIRGCYLKLDVYIDKKSGGPPITGEVEFLATQCNCELLIVLDSFSTDAYVGTDTCSVKLMWETVSEVDTVGFNIWRAQVKDSEYVNITKVNDQLVGIKAENDYQGASYSYEDHDVIPGNTYYYVLEDIDFSGLSTVHYDFIDSATIQPPLAISP